MELDSVKDAFARVAKKQKLCSSKSEEVIDQVGHKIEQALANMQSIEVLVDQKSVLTELENNLKTIDPLNQLEDSQKELNASLSKCSKVLEKVFYPDISCSYRDIDFDHHIVNQIILNHLYREGLFDAADCLINEAAEPEAISLKCQFIEMHLILEAVRSRNIEPALNWAAANREKIKQTSPYLELKLKRLQFLGILQDRSRAEALKYAKTYLASHAVVHMDEFQKLMGCLLWAGKLDKSPYSDLLATTHWDDMVKEITFYFCTSVGQSVNSPLSVALAAGADGLPTLLKLANLMAVKKQEWLDMEQLPVPVDLRKEFQFHSVFICPVSRDQNTDQNPPMLMSCGHVIGNESILKLSKNGTREFKCPYCPVYVTVDKCRKLYL